MNKKPNSTNGQLTGTVGPVPTGLEALASLLGRHAAREVVRAQSFSAQSMTTEPSDADLHHPAPAQASPDRGGEPAAGLHAEDGTELDPPGRLRASKPGRGYLAEEREVHAFLKRNLFKP